MSRDVIKSAWPRLQGKLRTQWPKLTYADVMFGEGDRDYLIATLKERYALDVSAAQRLVAKFERRVF